MISLLIFGLVAIANAAPHFDHSRQSHQHRRHHHEPSQSNCSQLVSNNNFDTNKFLADFQKEMKRLDDTITRLSQHFSTGASRDGVVGNEYRITMPLSEFGEKDTILKTREGCLKIQVNHNNSEGNENNDLNVKTLPATVTVNGKWNYDGGVLKIVFPLKEGDTMCEHKETQTVASVSVLDRETVAQAYVEDPVTSRDADVGLNRGDLDVEVTTKEVDDGNTVEDTTYDIDMRSAVASL